MATPVHSGNMLTVYKFYGVDSAGTGRCGCTEEEPAKFAERMWRAGWRKLTIHDDTDTCVGWIGRAPRRRTWWAVDPLDDPAL